MLNLICYLVAVVLLVLAAVLPDGVPHRDRLAYMGLAAFALPAFVYAAQHH